MFNLLQYQYTNYMCLVEAVRGIDAQAAMFLENDARSLSSFKPEWDLGYAFTWNKSPQGEIFWMNMVDKLIEKGYFNAMEEREE